jgi:ABC-type amino acid transport substrate-binding protein
MLSAYAVLSGDPVVGLEFVGRPVTEGTLGGTVHIALPKDDAVLRQSVNQAMAAMRADGTYHRIVRRYFPFNLD